MKRQLASASFSSYDAASEKSSYDLEVGSAAEETIAVLREADHHRRLRGRQVGLLGDEALHGPRLLVADVAVRQGHAAQQVGEAGELPALLRFQRVQGIHEIAQRRWLGVLLIRQAEPFPQTRQGHAPS